MKRRDFVKVGGSSLLAFALSKKSLFARAQADATTPIPITDPNPIQLLSWNQFTSQDFNGDDIERTHEALWNREGYIAQKGGIPKPSEFVDTVIVGGGISGLLAAHFLKHRKPVVLEQGANFGGNSRGEYFQGQSPFSIGAAYITKPDEGSVAQQLLVNLGLTPLGRTEGPNDSKILFRNQFYQGFWQGSTDPQAHQQFQQIYQQFQFILENKFPEIPWIPGSSVSPQELLSLDKLSFSEWLQQSHGNVHPHILEYFQLYCWSSFGGSMDEISAAQALNFLAAETDDVIAFPGGNAAITQALCNDLLKSGSPQSLRAGHLVLDVTAEADGVRVCYETPQRELRTLKARHCIMAAPKFVAKRVVSNMSAEQQKACDAIDYRAYVVANVFVDTRRIKSTRPEFSPCFDLYCLEGEVPPSPTAMRPPTRPYTDICFGSWAQKDAGDMGILTVYKPLPYQGARQFLFNPMSHSKYKSSIEGGIRDLLGRIGLQDSEVMGLRLTRWGHSMPLAQRGALSGGQLEMASRPIENKIFFANQDNWVNPSFETAVAVASQVAQWLR